MTDSSTGATLPDETRLGRTALTVSALDETRAFYRDVVGLSVQEETPTVTTLGAGETPLLELVADADAPARDRSEAGLYHVAFRVPSREALGDAARRVRERWQLSGASDHAVSEALYLRDPEGNGVEIYRDRPRETWPLTADGGVEMVTEPLDLDSLAADAAGADAAPPATDVGHVHLEVTSLESFREFYVETLGFAVRQRFPRAWFVAAGGYHHHVGANTWGERTTPKSGRGLSWFEVVVPDDDALDAVRERVEAGDHAVGETDRGIAVTDPDGIEIRIRAE